MEYKESGGAWTICSGDTISDLAIGTYYVRTRADRTILASNEESILIELHEHAFSYSADGAAITATCSKSGCPLQNHKAELTIEAPADLTYNRTGKTAQVTGDTDVLGTPTISYAGRGSTTYGPSETAPVKAGTYYVRVKAAGTVLASNEQSISITVIPQVAKPVFDPASGTYTEAQNVRITCKRPMRISTIRRTAASLRQIVQSIQL